MKEDPDRPGIRAVAAACGPRGEPCPAESPAKLCPRCATYRHGLPDDDIPTDPAPASRRPSLACRVRTALRGDAELEEGRAARRRRPHAIPGSLHTPRL